jgi:uncharacterized protein (DUF58 family)
MKWILGTLALLVVASLLRLTLVVYAMYVLLGVLLVSRFLAFQWIDGLVVSRRCDTATAEIGDRATVFVSIRNLGGLTIPWLLIEDSLPRAALVRNPPRIRPEGSRVALLRLKSEEKFDLVYKVELLRRGYYQVGPLLVESGDLFGLHRRYRVAGDPHFILVYPRVAPLLGYDIASRRPVGEVRMTHRLFEDPTRISGVRAYQMGDPLNRVHWPATARVGSLHSKIYEPSSVAGLTLLLDLHESGFATADSPALELMMTTAASLANAVYELGQQVGLISNGRDAADRIRVEGWQAEFRARSGAQRAAAIESQSDRLQPVIVETRSGVDQLRNLLEAIARLETTDGLAFSELISEAGSRLRRDATVVALLPKVDEAAALALGMLRRSGYSVLAILVMEGSPYLDWAVPPEWAGFLLAEGVPFRRVADEEELMSLCAEQLMR